VATRKVGFLHNRTKASFQRHYAAFVSRMHDFVEGENVIVIEKWAGDHLKKTLEQHAEDLVSQGVEVMVAAGGPQTALAAKKATKKIPIVFTPVTDPIGLNLVESLDHPARNLTGIAGMTSELDVTRLQLLRELLGGSTTATIGVLTNKNRPRVKEHLQTLGKAASEIDVSLEPMIVENLAEIDAAFKSFKGKEPDGFLVTADSLFNDLRKKVVVFPKKKPAIYQWREFAEAGGLMSFGPNIIEAYEKVGEYVGHILNGAKPGNLPVSLPDRFEMVINLRVALASRIAIPASLLSRAEFVHSRLRV
jgi:putative tryptophan/tyrosine transport system substrate-binding protein